MIFLPLALLLLALACYYFGHREDVEMFRKIAGIFVIAAVGVSIVLFLALSVK
jgi:hypothetical protein